MPRICYTPKKFQEKSLLLIAQANAIIRKFQEKGYDLTLRQLYYQLVSKNTIPNTQQSYGRLGSLINQARLAGLIDWYAIIDRTREMKGNSHWESPQEIVNTCVLSYKIDKWKTQDYLPEVWVEKEALVGIISVICRKLDVNYFACKGYVSQSEMWRGAMRMRIAAREGKIPIIIHLGDHDPSGIDMSRDIKDRYELFLNNDFYVERIALNWDQVQEYKPPPNPAKTTDSRYKTYIMTYGKDSWELDALEPEIISELIENTILEIRDDDAWDEAVREEQEGIDKLKEFSKWMED